MKYVIVTIILLTVAPVHAWSEAGYHGYVSLGGNIPARGHAPGFDADDPAGWVRAEVAAGIRYDSGWIFEYRHISWPQSSRDEGDDSITVRYEWRFGD